MHERKDGLRSDFLESKKKEMKSGNMEEIAQGVGLATSFDRWEGRKRTNERRTDSSIRSRDFVHTNCKSVL